MTRPLYFNTFENIEKVEPNNYGQDSVAINFSIIFFEKIALDLTVANRSLLLEHLEKAGKTCKRKLQYGFQPLIGKSNYTSVKNFCF